MKQLIANDINYILTYYNKSNISVKSFLVDFSIDAVYAYDYKDFADLTVLEFVEYCIIEKV